MVYKVSENANSTKQKVIFAISGAIDIYYWTGHG